MVGSQVIRSSMVNDHKTTESIYSDKMDTITKKTNKNKQIKSKKQAKNEFLRENKLFFFKIVLCYTRIRRWRTQGQIWREIWPNRTFTPDC